MTISVTSILEHETYPHIRISNKGVLAQVLPLGQPINYS